jgi:DNA processing protein
MAAISDLVLVIEAKEKSGTQITARLALEYNKDVAIVPGSIFSQYSSGTAQLYKSGAYPVTCSDDILEILGIKIEDTFVQENMFEEEFENDTHIENNKKILEKLNQKNKENLSEHEQVLLRLLQAPLGKDELIESSGLLAHEAIIAITNLESKKYIVEIYGEMQRLR